MEYFELSQSPRVENPVVLTGIDRDAYSYAMPPKRFEALDRLIVAYFSGNEREEPCDILTDPTFMVSDGLKKLLALYSRETAFKGVQALPASGEGAWYPMYWVPCFPEIACMHESSAVYGNGMISSLVLEGGKIGKQDVFRLSGCLEYKVVVSLPVAESILRRRFYGIGLKKLEVA